MDIRSLIEPDGASGPRIGSDQSPAKRPTTLPQGRTPGAWTDPRATRSLTDDARRPSLPPPSPSHHLPQHALPSSISNAPHASFYQNSEAPRLDSPIEQLRSPLFNVQRNSTFTSDHRSSLGTPTHTAQRTSIPLPQTPTGSTPSSAGGFPGWHRPTSSHSTTTPTSAQIQGQSFSQLSPQASGTNGSVASHAPLHQISPRLSTHIGPPPTRSRQSLDSQFSSPRSAGHKRNISGELRTNSRPQHSVSPSQASSRAYLSHDLNGQYERQQSISVSPKTQSVGLPSNESPGVSDRSPGFYSEHTINRRAHDLEAEASFPIPKPLQPSARRTSSMGIDAMLNSTQPNDFASDRLKRSFGTANGAYQSDMTSSDNRSETSLSGGHEKIDSLPPGPRSSIHASQNLSMKSPGAAPPQLMAQSSPVLSRATSIRDDESNVKNQTPSRAMMPPSSNSASLPPKFEQGISPQPPDSSSQPAKKKPRLTSSTNEASRFIGSPPNELDIKPAKPPRLPMPIWAHSVRPNNPGKRRGKKRNPATKIQSSSQVNGHSQIDSNQQLPPPSKSGPLGNWEPSILNIIPQDEITKFVADFLFAEVMQNPEIGVLPLGGSSQGGAVLEIEAKLGRLIDKGTNDRISIPVMTEAILNRNSPNIRTAFESSMTEYQHRALNAFLNKALLSTKQPKSVPPIAQAQKPARVPMDYKHTKELDTFYELSQRGLLSLPNSLNVSTRTSHGNKMKVRVTHDQKTGKELAKIVKIRLADIDIYSPHNQVDWRISVNVEMNFQGDLGDLIEPERKQGGAGDRAKDRLTYHHQAYQIDLTQVSPFEVSVP